MTFTFWEWSRKTRVQGEYSTIELLLRPEVRVDLVNVLAMTPWVGSAMTRSWSDLRIERKSAVFFASLKRREKKPCTTME